MPETHHAILIADSFQFVVDHLIPRINRLLEHHFDVHVIAPNSDALHLLPKEVFVRQLPAKWLSSPVHFLLVHSYLIELKPTLIHAYGWQASLWVTSLQRTLAIPAVVVSLNKPTIVEHLETLPNKLPLQLTYWFNGDFPPSKALSNLSSTTFEKLFKSVSLFFVHSPDDATWLKEKMGVKRPIKILDGAGCGVDVVDLQPEEPTSYQAREIFNIATLLENGENYDWAIEVIIETLAERFDTNVTIGVYQDNPTLDRFQRLSRYHHIQLIEIPRHSSSDTAILKEADLYLELNQKTSYRMLMTAMSKGVPVVALQTPVASYLLGEEDARTFTPLQRLETCGGTTCDHDDDAWCALIHHLLDAPNRLQLARGKARQRATRMFNQAKIDYEVLQAYDSLLNPTPPRPGVECTINDLLNY